MIETCVVISYYDQRSSYHLHCLIEQLKTIEAGLPFKLIVSVNSHEPKMAMLEIDYKSVFIIYRQNGGYNMGCWQAVWEQFPHYKYYVFLQDDCKILKPNWLLKYIQRVRTCRRFGMLTESLVYWRTWGQLKKKYPHIHKSCCKMAKEMSIPLGSSPTHAQTLIVITTQSVLKKIGGFILADEKMDAVASEVLLSRKIIALKLRVLQVSWRPFEYIGHPQWDDFRSISNSALWSLKQVLKKGYNFFINLLHN